MATCLNFYKYTIFLNYCKVFFIDTEISSDLMSIDPIDYTLQSDAQLVNAFYGDKEIDYNKRKNLADIKAMPIDFYKSDSSFTLLP